MEEDNNTNFGTVERKAVVNDDSSLKFLVNPNNMQPEHVVGDNGKDDMTSTTVTGGSSKISDASSNNDS